MKTYRIVLANNSGSFAVDAIAHSVGGTWRNCVQKFDDANDLAFVDLPEENCAYLEETLESDGNVISYGEVTK